MCPLFQLLLALLSTVTNFSNLLRRRAKNLPITSKRLTILILLDAVTMAVRLMLEDGRVKV